MALQQEEVEIKADGSRETIRPSRLGLARVSVLRGSGVDEGVPFIDDYIATTTEPIVDHLTAYSGIQPGDLDPSLSTHHLVPLKAAYKKLWLLLHLGCVFVGHGLPKDFRIINIYVPKSQVVDTVELFFIRARQRKLSLRFLAWYVLREEIQLDSHDSIEDARTALRLWRKYLEFVDAGVFERILADIYAKGREVQFKVPSSSFNIAATATATAMAQAAAGVAGVGVGVMVQVAQQQQLGGGAAGGGGGGVGAGAGTGAAMGPAAGPAPSPAWSLLGSGAFQTDGNSGMGNADA